MVSLHSKEQKDRSWYQELGIAVMGLTTLFVGEMWTTLEVWTRNMVERFNQGLMGHPSRGMEDSIAEDNVDYAGPVQEVSEGKNISMWHRNSSPC